MEMKMIQRINRILSEAGLASRRKADELIASGRVMLNGKMLRELGAKAEWGKDSIKVDGSEIPKPEKKLYLILNKPFGYVCTLNDPEKRRIVTDLLRDIPRRVYPVGRLDFDSMGLLLLTNDGDFSFQMTHPKYHIPKTYKVTVDRTASANDIERLKNGIELEDGFIKASNAAIIGRQGEKSLVRLTISQGRNRIVRRMIEALGYSVVHLVRIGFGSLELGDLKVGRYRILEPEEVKELMEMTTPEGRKRIKARKKEQDKDPSETERPSAPKKDPRDLGDKDSRETRRPSYIRKDPRIQRGKGSSKIKRPSAPRKDSPSFAKAAAGRSSRDRGFKESSEFEQKSAPDKDSRGRGFKESSETRRSSAPRRDSRGRGFKEPSESRRPSAPRRDSRDRGFKGTDKSKGRSSQRRRIRKPVE